MSTLNKSATLGADLTAWPDSVATYYREMGYWQGETLSQMLHASTRQHAHCTALVCGERRWTYAELERDVERLACGLHQRSLVAGDRVVLQMPNCAELLLACFALFRLGLVPVFALPAHRRAEITYFCELSEARAYLIADRDAGFDYRQLAREVQAQVPTLAYVVVLGEAEEFYAFDSLMRDSSIELPHLPTDASALAFLQLSGGSTGLPKLIPRTHDDYLYSVRASASICGLNAQSVYLCALPVLHNFPFSSPGVLGVLYAGGCVVMARHPSPDVVFPLIQRERVTISALVPPLAVLWMEAARSRSYDLSSLQVLQIGGARLGQEVAERIAPALGCELQQVFGMAEGLVNYTRHDDSDDLIFGTQGRPISPADEIRIVDDADEDVAPGSSGHLLTRGPYTIRGYYRAAAHNQTAFTADGFYRTGDIVRQLPSGHLVVEGRAKDQINRGGEKLAAEEVENHLLTHAAVLDVAIVAMPDAYLGERACAFIVARDLSPHRPPRSAELAAYLRERGLANYKVPDRFEFVSSFPKTGVGKVDKRALRARFTPL